MKSSLMFAVPVMLVCASSSRAASITAIYGDQDGFGVGATVFKNPLVNSASVGEAAGTDVRRIGTGFAAPAFAPTATLAFAPLTNIVSVIVTMSMAEFGGNINPVDPQPNAIVVNGSTVPVAFLNSFASIPNGFDRNIETQSFALPASFFPLFATGSVDLTGTHISERSGFASFQVDYLKFDITNVPEPGSFALMAAAFAGFGLMLRRRGYSR